MANFWSGLDSASSIAPATDTLFFALLIFFSVIALIIGVTIVVFCVRYRRTATDKRKPAPLSHFKFEMAVIAIIFFVGTGIFAWSGADFIKLRTVPANALEIHAYPKQWMWKFEQANGRREVNTLHVPLNRDIKLMMISEDVIHSLFIPDFRVKADVLPGRYTTLWFRPTKVGHFQILCSQYCGVNHATMRAEVIVMEPAEFERWNSTPTQMLSESGDNHTTAATGEALFARMACISCHSADRLTIAPSLNGIWNRPVKLANGQTVVVDENYLRQSMINPNAQIVAGYRPQMPTFQGLLNEQELVALIEYIKQLKSTPETP